MGLAQEEVRLSLDRSYYSDQGTLSDLFIDGVWECVALEDRIRKYKVPGDTAIPEGTFAVRITWSPKFKRHLPLLIGVPGFDGIRMHWGVDHRHTEGCVLTGENYQLVGGKPILLHSKRAFDRLFARLETAQAKGESISIEVVNRGPYAPVDRQG